MAIGSPRGGQAPSQSPTFMWGAGRALMPGESLTFLPFVICSHEAVFMAEGGYEP
jgi:hypothetical protein